jgi:hypothetical protein
LDIGIKFPDTSVGDPFFSGSFIQVYLIESDGVHVEAVATKSNDSVALARGYVAIPTGEMCNGQRMYMIQNEYYPHPVPEDEINVMKLYRHCLPK